MGQIIMSSNPSSATTAFTITPSTSTSTSTNNPPSTSIINSLAITRLAEERKQWRKDHPFGFVAKPISNPDGSLDLLKWECAIPGKIGTPWEGGLYRINLYFNNDYPSQPPKCQFIPPIPHVNIFDSGAVCISLLKDWRPATTIKQLLLGIHQLLDEPNPKSPANQKSYILYRENIKKYEEEIRLFASKHRPL